MNKQLDKDQISALADETIVGIYHYFQPRAHEGNPPQYYLLHVLDHRGVLDHEMLTKIYKDKFQHSPDRDDEMMGPFDSLEELNKYAYFLCEEVNAPRVSLLSVTEYNLLLENASELNGLVFDLKNKGNVLENIERDNKKTYGFFSKLFK